MFATIFYKVIDVRKRLAGVAIEAHIIRTRIVRFNRRIAEIVENVQYRICPRFRALADIGRFGIEYRGYPKFLALFHRITSGDTATSHTGLPPSTSV